MAKIIVSSILIGIGVIFYIFNIIYFIHRRRNKSENPSPAPLVGLIFSLLGLMHMPNMSGVQKLVIAFCLFVVEFVFVGNWFKAMVMLIKERRK